LAQARSTLQQEQKDWRKHLEHERQVFNARLQQTGAEPLLKLTRKALHELADATLEDAIVRHIGKQLQPMAAELIQASAGSQQAQLTSADGVPVSKQQWLQNGVLNCLPQVMLSFATDAKQSPGLIIQVGGAHVAWTTDTYIDGLAELLTQQAANSAAVRLSTDER